MHQGSDSPLSGASAIRHAVNEYGLKVECLLCGARGRHRPEEDGRLRYRPCPGCGVKSLRLRAWVKRYPAKAYKRVSEHLAGERVFAP